MVAEGLSVRAAEEIVTLGESDESAATQRSPRSAPNPRASEIAGQLADRLDSPCPGGTVERAKVNLIIEFASTGGGAPVEINDEAIYRQID